MDSKIESAILKHLKMNVSLSKEEVEIEEKIIDTLPKSLSIFYVVKKDSYHNVWYYYVISEKEIFSSRDEDSFERLLAQFKFLEKKNLTAEQVVTLFSMLKVRLRDVDIVREENFLPGGPLNEFKDMISIPSFAEVDGNVKIIFWTLALRSGNVERWRLILTSGYQTQYDRQTVAKLE